MEDDPRHLEHGAAVLAARGHGSDALSAAEILDDTPRTGLYALFLGRRGNLAVTHLHETCLSVLRDAPAFAHDLEAALPSAVRVLDDAVRKLALATLSRDAAAAVLVAVRDGHVYTLEAAAPGLPPARAVLARAEGNIVPLARAPYPADLGQLDQNPRQSAQEPAVDVVGLDFEDEFILMASGVVWDVLDDAAAVSLVRNVLRRGGSIPRAAQRVVQAAAARGVRDNIAVQVVLLSSAVVGGSTQTTTADSRDMSFVSVDPPTPLTTRRTLFWGRHRSASRIHMSRLSLKMSKKKLRPSFMVHSADFSTSAALASDNSDCSSVTSPSSDGAPPRTISAALAPHANRPEDYKTYHPYLTMTKRFIGDEPSFYPILTLSTAAINTHVGLFGRMFHCPAVDMRLPGFLPPDLRRVAFLTASESFHCDYCHAHAFCFGDMLRGSVPSQVRRSRTKSTAHSGGGGGGGGGGGAGLDRTVSSSPSSKNDAEAEEAVRAFAATAVRRPMYENVGGPSLRKLAAVVKKHAGRRGLEIVMAVVAFAGALNTVMDIQGVTLEEDVQIFTGEHLKTPMGEGWKPREHHLNMTERAMSVHADDADRDLPRRSGPLANVSELMRTMPAAMTGMKFEMFTLYARIPTSTRRLNEWVEDRLGARGAKFFYNVEGTELKRAFCFGLRENLLVDEDCASGEAREWLLPQRIAFLYVFASLTGSMELCDNAAVMMAQTLDTSVAEAAKDLEDFTTCKSRDLSSSLAAGRRLVVAVAQKTDNIPAELVTQLAGACSAEAIIELASLLSFYEMWRRLSLLFLLDVERGVAG